MPTPSLSALHRAVKIQEEIEKLEGELNALLSGGVVASPTRESAIREAPPKAPKKRRKMSPEARARIVAAQKKRWEKFRKAKK
jgi:hypothetical protein